MRHLHYTQVKNVWSLDISGLNHGGSYNWYVQAKNSKKKVKQSTIYSFTLPGRKSTLAMPFWLVLSSIFVQSGADLFLIVFIFIGTSKTTN